MGEEESRSEKDGWGSGGLARVWPNPEIDLAGGLGSQPLSMRGTLFEVLITVLNNVLISAKDGQVPNAALLTALGKLVEQLAAGIDVSAADYLSLAEVLWKAFLEQGGEIAS